MTLICNYTKQTRNMRKQILQIVIVTFFLVAFTALAILQWPRNLITGESFTYKIPQPLRLSGTLTHFKLIPRAFCSDETYLLIGVISTIDHFAQRKKIRDSWRDSTVSSGAFWSMCTTSKSCDLREIQIVFITGTKENNKTLQKQLQEEQHTFGDILQGPFNDTYRNLVHKTILLLDYAVNQCGSAKFIQKIDDNVRLNLTAVKHLLNMNPDMPAGYVIGLRTHMSPVMRGGKWKVTKEEYKEDHYPDYLGGSSYIISRNASVKLLNVARKEPLVPVEDVFLTGICRIKTDVKIMHSSQFCSFGRVYNCITQH